GYRPFETRIEVAGEQTVPVAVKLEPLGISGHVRIAEADGKPALVLVDNSAVGKAPWEGDLGPGTHLVVLRGEGNVGSQPVTIAVAPGEPPPVSVQTEALDSSLRVEPTPAGAAVAIDSVNVGLGVWEGRLRSGDHKVEVMADGFVRKASSVTLVRGKPQTVS